MTYSATKIEVSTSSSLEGDTFYKKIHYLTLGQGHMKCCPVHNVTYSATKFEVAMSNGLGEDTFTRKVKDGWMKDRLWYEIYIHVPFFLKKKAGITF